MCLELLVKLAWRQDENLSNDVGFVEKKIFFWVGNNNCISRWQKAVSILNIVRLKTKKEEVRNK